MRKLLLPIALIVVSVMLLVAPATAFGATSDSEMVIPAGYRTVHVTFGGIDPVSLSDGMLSLRVNGSVDFTDIIALIDDQLAYGGSVEESCTTRMRWVPGTTHIVGASGGTLNLQSTLALATRSCEPTMSMYTTSQHTVDYDMSVMGSGIDDLAVSVDVTGISDLPEGSTMSAARLDQIADANLQPLTAWVRAVAQAYQTGCLATADVSLNPLAFSTDGTLLVGINASGNLESLGQCMVLPSELSDLAIGTNVVPLILADLQPGTVTSIVDSALMGDVMSVDSYISMVSDDLADDTWKAIALEALSLEWIQDTVISGMGGMVPAQLQERLFTEAALEQIWGEILLADVSADTIEGLVLAIATGMGDPNELSAELISQIQPSSLALALARLLTLG